MFVIATVPVMSCIQCACWEKYEIWRFLQSEPGSFCMATQFVKLIRHREAEVRFGQATRLWRHLESGKEKEILMIKVNKHKMCISISSPPMHTGTTHSCLNSPCQIS